MNDYQKIKSHMLKIIKDSEIKEKTKNVIQKEILEQRKLVETLFMMNMTAVIPGNPISNLTEEQWLQLEKEIIEYFEVESTEGMVITGSKGHNQKWFTDSDTDNYYWHRYKKQLTERLPKNVVDVLDRDTNNIVNHLGDVSEASFSKYGMVVGHVQSGKTANYTGVITKAVDAGYKFIIVIAGGMNNLRNQTQQRINYDFVGRNLTGKIGVGLDETYNDASRQPISLTLEESDFNKKIADTNSQGLSFENIQVPIIMVVKKNTATLRNISNWLNSHYRNKQIPNHAMLLIDDESDYASINTVGEDSPTAINRGIRDILKKFEKSTYLAYTATPYANIFIDYNASNTMQGDDLFPRDFIYLLKEPSNYFGAKKIFSDNQEKHIITIPEQELGVLIPKHKKNTLINELPIKLKEAVRLFCLNVAIRELRYQKSNNSMLIHGSRFTDMHKQIARLTEEYLGEMQTELALYGERGSEHSQEIAAIKETCYLRHTHVVDVEFSWKQILKELCNKISTIKIFEVHNDATKDSKDKLEYTSEEQLNAIVIGGTSLSRGYTLEGLSVSYFVRNTIYYDTLMQMGRWFGYRDNYEDLCRIYMEENMIQNFQNIADATRELFDNFKEMREQNLTPLDFGLAVKLHPDSMLQVTAVNKRKHTENIEVLYELSLEGVLKETVDFSKDQSENDLNTKKIIDLVKKIESKPLQKKGSTYVWSDVNKATIIEFIDQFTTYNEVSNNPTIRFKMPKEIIKDYIEKNLDDSWKVALYSGEGESFSITEKIKIQKARRQMIENQKFFQVKNRQLSTGSAEAVGLDDTIDAQGKKIDSNNRQAIRKNLKQPLLMLHIIQSDNSMQFSGFGVSFPGIAGKGKPQMLTVNKVYLEQMDLYNEPDIEE